MLRNKEKLNISLSGDVLERIQCLPARYHWALSDYQLLLSVYGNRPVVRTGRLYVLSTLVKMSLYIGVVWPFILLVGVAEVFRLIACQYAAPRNTRNKPATYPASFFVGFGVGKEDEIIAQRMNKQFSPIGMLHQYKIETFSCWHHVGFMSIVRELFRATRCAKEALLALPAELANRRIDFLTYIASKIAYYSFMRSWFETMALKTNLTQAEFVFSGQNVAAFAAVDAGVRAIYFSHGMITRCELLPGFSAVNALSVEEAIFIRNRLPNADVTVYSPSRRRLIPAQMSREILITSCPLRGDKSYMLGVIPLINWANENKIPVRVRLHPAEEASFFWWRYENDGLITFEDRDIDFFQVIYKRKPRLLISWVSTTLADVLPCGVIPITACVDTDLSVSELVYPIFRRCLNLQEGFDCIFRLMNDNSYYEYVLKKLSANDIDFAGSQPGGLTPLS